MSEASSVVSNPDPNARKKGNTDVFISYSRKDHILMKQLHKELDDLNRDVWVDWEDITPTDDWLTAIFDAIEKTSTFLIIISPNSVISPICNMEIDHAVRLNKRLVPIILEDVKFENVLQSMDEKTLNKPVRDKEDKRLLKDLMQENWRAMSHPSWLYFRNDDEFKASFPRLLDAIDKDLPYVHDHTRWLIPALQWETNNRNTSFLLKGIQLREAEAWLAKSEGLKPAPTDLHRTYIITSRQEENRQQRTRNIIVAFAFAVLLGLAAFGWIQSQSAQTSLSTAEARGTEVANQAATATNAQGQAQEQAVIAATQAAIAKTQAGIAQIAGTAESKARATSVSNALTATNAQGEAQVQAANAGTQAAIALNNAMTATNAQGQAQVQAANAATQAAIALNNAATATYAQGQAQVQGDNAATQAAIAKTQAGIAQIAGTAESKARATSVSDAATATNAQGEAQVQAANAGTQAAIALNNALTATNAQGQAQVQAANAATQAAIALNNAATATNAQGQAQIQAINAQKAATSEANARSTSVSDAATATNAQGEAQVQAANAATQAAIALNNAATATNAQGQAQVQADNAATQAANAQNAQATSVVNENNAVNNAATAVVAQNAAVVAQQIAEKRANETQSFALTVAIENLVNLGNPDLALALALEAVRIDPNSWVAQKRLLDVTFAPGTRLIFDQQHNGPVTSLTYSKDGKYVASSSLDGTIILWDAQTGKMLQRFVDPDYPDGVNSVAFSPDGSQLISASDDNSLKLWDRNGEILHRFQNKNALGQDVNYDATSAVFRPDGQTIISGWGDGQVIVFETNGAEIPPHMLVAKGAITHLSLSPDPLAQFFLAISAGNVSVWNSRGREVRSNFFGKGGAGAYSPDGNYVLISSASDKNSNLKGNDLILYEISSSQEKGRYRGHTAPVTDIAFLPDGKRAISASEDGIIILWDIQEQKELHRYYGHKTPNDETRVTSIAVNPDGHSFVSADDKGQIRLWDIDPDGIKSQFAEVKPMILGLQYSRDTKTILVSYDNQSVGFWNIADNKDVAPHFSHHDVITSFAYDPEEKNVLVADASGTVVLWNPVTFKEIRRFSARGGSAVAIYSADGKTIATGDALGFLRLWDIDKVDPRVRLETKDGAIIGLFYLDDGKELLTIHPSALVIRNGETGEVIRKFVSTAPITKAVLSPDEHWVLTASGNSMTIWNIIAENGAAYPFTGDGEQHKGAITSLAFSPDGSAALSSSVDGTIQLWDVANRRRVFIYRDGEHIPHGVVFNPDGQTFAASYDHQIVIFWSGARPVLSDWVKQNRYLPEVTCADRVQYSLNPPCMANGVVPTLTPTGIQLPTTQPTITLTPSPTLPPTAVPLPIGHIVSSAPVNVHIDKYDTSQTVAQVSNGEKVTILEDKSQTPGWIHIRTESGIEGWIVDHFIQSGEVTPTPTPFFGGRTATPSPSPTAYPQVTLRADNGGMITVRKGAGTGFGIVEHVPSGTNALLLDEHTRLGWAHIYLEDGKDGWVLIGVVK